MKKIFTILLVMPFIWACSSSDSNNESGGSVVIKDKKIVTYVGESIRVDLIGDKLDRFSADIEDEFVAGVSINDGKLSISPYHVGRSTITVYHKNVSTTCELDVKAIDDVVGSTVTKFGITKEELKELIEEPYDYYFNDIQQGSVNYTYIKNGYRIINAYFIDEDGLYGVKKKIIAEDSDMQMFLKIGESMSQYAKHLSYTKDRVTTTFPNYDKTKDTYSYPNKYYAIYEQKIFEEYAPGKSPETTNYIYFAKDLETAQKYNFGRN